MAITYHGIQPGRSGKLYESESLSYIFRSDDENDELLHVLNDPNCPKLHEKHPFYRWMYAANLSYTQGSGKEWQKWVITIEYKLIKWGDWPGGSPTPINPPTQNQVPDTFKEGDKLEDLEEVEPVDYAVHVSVGFEDYPGPVSDAFSRMESQTGPFGMDDFSTRGTPIVNSALEPYDPPPERQYVNAILDIRLNINFKDALLNQINDLNNSINLKAFEYRSGSFVLPCSALSGRLRYTLSENRFDDRLKDFYRELQIQIVCKRVKRGWLIRLLDIGSYEFSVPGTVPLTDRMDEGVLFNGDWPDKADPKPFTDAAGNPMHRMLDGFGNLLEDGKPVVFNEYYSNKQRDWQTHLFSHLNRIHLANKINPFDLEPKPFLNK